MADRARQGAGELSTGLPGFTSSESGRPLRVAVVGISVSPTCGVRAHATLLAEALERANFTCSSHWLSRDAGSFRGARSEIREWTARLEGELRERQPDVVLFHYSVFSYSYRGVPLFVHDALSPLRASRVPVLSVLHEFAYPWMYGGLRGAAWAVTQRAALIEVMRVSAAALVTADFRARWLASRRWLPRRPVQVAPVFSNLPAPAGGSPSERPRRVVGLFGYSYQGAALALILDALDALRRRGVDVDLALLGAPGPSSPAGQAWSAAAQERGLEDRLSFSGALDAQALSNTLAACDVLLFADAAGPSSRKGTLAGSLASGTAVVAIDGPRRWPELLEAQAAEVVPATAEALADAVGALLLDDPLRQELGRRGRAFAEQRMGVERTVAAVEGMLEVIPVEPGGRAGENGFTRRPPARPSDP